MAESSPYETPRKKPCIEGRNYSPATVARNPSSRRVYLNSQYREKDTIKALGAIYDWRVKKWYVYEDFSNFREFKRWLPSADSTEDTPSVRLVGRGERPQSTAADSKPRAKIQKLTVEQEEVVGYKVHPSVFASIIAGAGTGKTSTLIELSNRHRDKAILYCAFNKEAQQDARRRFDSHVECKTLHSLAYGWFGRQHAGEAIKIAGDFDNFEDIGSILGFRAEGVKQEDFTKVGRFVWDTMLKFCQSNKAKCELVHVPKKAVEWHDEMKSQLYPYPEWADKCFKIALDTKDGRLPIQHDIYLKYAQLQEAQFLHPKMGKPFEIVLLDEAQDISECQASIVQKQIHAARFLIGDPHQSIYQFRGSDHSLERLGPQFTKTFKLQTSFRFGENIEHAANLILWWKRCVIHIYTKGKSRYGKPIKLNLVGGKRNWETDTAVPGIVRYPRGSASKTESSSSQSSNTSQTSLQTNTPPSTVEEEKDQFPCTIIGRSNKGLVDSMIDVVTKHLKLMSVLKDDETIEKLDFSRVDLSGLKIGIVGKNSKNRMKRFMWLAIEIQNLREKKPVKKLREIRRYSTFDDLMKGAEDTQDQTLLMLISWVENWGTATKLFAKLMIKLLDNALPWNDADYRFSTVHQSKGLEFEKVRLANDFTALIDLSAHNKAVNNDTIYDAKPMLDEVFNLFYVAVTRAKNILEINGVFKSFVKRLNVLLEANLLPEDFLKEDPCPVPMTAIENFVKDFD